MPRRRMLDPSFTEDTEVAQLTRDERLFLVGCLRNADDEGRLIGNAAYLKAEIFMYDDDIDLKYMQKIRNSVLEKIKKWRQDNIWRLSLYQNSGIEYLHFPNWYGMEKPSHPTPSKLPIPSDMGSASSTTQEINPKVSGEAREEISKSSEQSPEEIEKVSGAIPPQSSQGKNSLVKSSRVNTPLLRKGARTKQVDPIVNEIFTEIRTYLGFPDRVQKDPIPNYGKEGQAIKRMLTRGFTREEVTACWKQKVDARGGEFVSMTWVNEDIGKKGGKAGEQRQRQKRAKPITYTKGSG